MKFKERIYLITLTIFLVFFNIGIYVLAHYVHMTTVDSEKSVAISEEKTIIDSLEKDLTYLGLDRIKEIGSSYLSFYKDKGIYLSIILDNESYSNIPFDVKINNNEVLMSKRINQSRYFVVGERIFDDNIFFIYVKDVSYIDDDYNKICTVFLTMSFFASIILSVVLFFTMKRLSSPLEQLRIVATEISRGNFTIRANDLGTDDFSLLAKDFNIMADHIIQKIDELDRSTQTKQRILDDLSHEMKTPLTSIRGYAEFLKNANISEKERIESLEFIFSEAERLKLISERLLDDAFIRENGITTSKVDLSGLIDESIKKHIIPSNIKILYEKKNVYCNCDELLVEMLFNNLLDNAIKACGENGNIIVVTDIDENEKPFFCISDDGIGMTEEQVERITEPFYRTDKSRSRINGGTGLGLTLCDRIVKAHNAQMHFTSAPGSGTKVLVNFTNS